MIRHVRIIFLLALVLLYGCRSSKTTSSTAPASAKDATEKLTNREKEKRIDKAISTAYSFKGTPYKMGGMNKKGMDCSGLVCVSFREAGLVTPRTTSELLKAGKTISLNDVTEGDLLFFATKKKSKAITHVGIVSKVSKDDVLFIHASTKLGVTEDKLSAKYYKETFVKALRLF